MKANCEYCGSEIDNTLEECPHCGAKNPNFQRTVTGTPKTIDELKDFCDSKGLKLDTMHIHLGEDFKEPKAFGIYKNSSGDCVVYKNKADGTRAIRYQGSDGMNGGSAGDLNIIISVRPHSVFERDGDDLYCDVPITFAEAALGAEIDIQTLEGAQKYTIPEGTQTGTTFTLKNRGVARVNNPKIRGNLYLTVNVEVPKNLNAEQKSLLEKFAASCGESNYSKRTGFFKKHRKNG